MNETINWGIIGCGEVTEVKSGPAFNKVSNSRLIAVMRRDIVKARSYAYRHAVPFYYSDAKKLIEHPGINAIYIATPPSTHEQYALQAINVRKHVYLEKPMSLDYDSAMRITEAAEKANVKLVIAHYRRYQPIFLKIKELLNSDRIGKVQLVTIQYFRRALEDTELKKPNIAWRLNPAISGGGLFHDLSPHQLDLLIYYFGQPVSSSGISLQQQTKYKVPDLVTGNCVFPGNVVFNGCWHFNSSPEFEEDSMNIIGSAGKITFKVFQHEQFSLWCSGEKQVFTFPHLDHVQQPMIEQVVSYFQGKSANPCPGSDAAEVMKIIDTITR